MEFEDLADEIARNHDFQEFWKTIEADLVGLFPQHIDSFKEIAYRGWAAGHRQGTKEVTELFHRSQ